MQRDGYFAGFRTALDLDRLLHNIWIDNYELKVKTGGIVTLEQILFNKIQSFSRIYHHHKVRSAECIIRGALEIIKDRNLQIAGRKLDKAVDFLNLSDRDILYLNDKEPELREYLKRFSKRDLFKRALVISSDTVKWPKGKGYNTLKELSEDRYQKTRQLRSLLVEALGNKLSIYEIWVDLPKSPHTMDSAQTIIQDGPNSASRKLSEHFPADQWLDTYQSGKWQGHVFCPSDPKIRHLVNEKAKEVFFDVYGIEFTNFATDWAKIP